MHAHAAYSRNLAAAQRSRREGRRLRFIQRIESAPDAPGRWALFVAQIARLVDGDQLDRLLEVVIETPPERVQLYKQFGAARQ
jgi:hypothetical protein